MCHRKKVTLERDITNVLKTFGGVMPKIGIDALKPL